MLVAFVCVGLAAIAAVVAGRAKSFGGVRASMIGELKDDRAQLTSARRNVKRCSEAVAAESASTHAALTSAEAAYGQRVTAAEAALATLTNPGSGALVNVVGSVRLFEHVLEVAGQQHWLSGLAATAQLTEGCTILAVRLASGHTLVTRFDTSGRAVGRPTDTEHPEGDRVALESSQRMVRDHSEAQIAAFAAAINHQAIWHAAFMDDAPKKIPAAELALHLARADTAACEQARSALARLEHDSEAKRALDRAESSLVDRQQRYDEAVAVIREQRDLARTGSVGARSNRRAPRTVALGLLALGFASGAAALLMIPLVDGPFGAKFSALKMYQEHEADEAIGLLIGSGACAVAALVFLVMAIGGASRRGTATSRGATTGTVPVQAWGPPSR